MTEGALHFNALLTTRDFERGIERIRNDIRRASGLAVQETSKMDNAFKSLSIGIAGYFSGQALMGFTRQLINIRGEFQKTEIAFGTMLKSSAKAKALMGEMVDLAAKTPFSLQDVSNGAKQLLAFQVPANEVVDTLKRMGDIAAGLGVPLSRINLVYGQVKAKGKLMGDDLRQFTEAGIPMVAELAKKFGKTTAEIQAMVSAGKIGFNDVKEVLFGLTDEGGMFFNLMDKQSESLSGKVSNLGDAFDQMLNKIGESNEGILNKGIDGAIYLVEHYEEVLEVIKGLVVAYGTYRAALITVAAIENVRQKTIAKNIALLSISEKMQLGRALVTERQAKANLREAETEQIATQEKYLSLQAEVASLNIKKQKAIALATEKQQLLENATLELTTAQQKLSVLGAEASAREVNIATKRVEKAENAVLKAQERAEIARKGALTASSKFYTSQKELETVATRVSTNAKRIETAQEAVSIATKNANAIAEKRFTATQMLRVSATQLVTKVQAILNATMLNNPIVLVIMAIGGLVYAYYNLYDATTEQEKAEKRLNEQRKESKERVEEYIQKLNELKSVVLSETATAYQKQKAYEELQRLGDERIKQTKKETLEKMSLLEVNKMLAEAKDEKELKESLNLLQEHLDLLQQYKKDYYNAQKAGAHVNGDVLQSIAEKLKAEESIVYKIQEQIRKEQEKRNWAKMSSEEKLAYLKEEEKCLQDTVKLEEQKIKALKDAGFEVDKIGSLFYNWGNGLRNALGELNEVQNKINEIQGAVKTNENPQTKEQWQNKRKEVIQYLDDNGGTENKANASKIAELRRIDKELEKYNYAVKGASRSTKKFKDQLNEPIKGSLGELEKELSKVQDQLRNKTLISDSKKRKELLSKEKELQEQINEIQRQFRQKSFDEELSELERQWRIRYQLAEIYGEEVAKAQFPKLGDSYFDDIQKMYNPLNNKMVEGIALSDTELAQWEKLEGIIKNLLGEKDPFTTWKESMDEQLKGMNTFSERLTFLNDELRNLTADDVSNGKQALLIQRINEEKEGYKELYNNFLEEHKTLEEQKTAITEKYAQLRALAETDAEKEKVNDAEKQELSQIEFDAFKNSGDWVLAFENLEYAGTETINRLIERFEAYQKAQQDNLAPTEMRELADAIQKLRQQANRNPFAKIVKGAKGYFSATKRVKKAQDTYNQALQEFGRYSKQAKKAQQELTDAELEAIKSKEALVEGLDKGQAIFNAVGEGVQEIAGMFGGLDEASQDAIEDILNVGNAALDLGTSIATGDTAGMISAGIKLVSSLFDAMSGDKAKARNIKRWAGQVDRLKDKYRDLERSIKDAMGQQKYEGQKQMTENLQQQQIRLQKMLDEARSKKKKDQEEIKAIQEQIKQTEEAIKDLQESMVDSLLQTDLKTLIDDFTNSVVEAWQKGEDAAKSYEKVAKQAIRNAVIEMLKSTIVAAQMQQFKEQFLNAMGYSIDSEGNVVGEFDGITEDEAEYLQNIMKGMVEPLTQALEGMKFLFDDLESDSSTLKGAIKGMSEETAGVLVGQFNAIRILQAQAVKIMEDNFNTMKASVMCLVKIEQNTYNLFQMKNDLRAIKDAVSNNNNQLRPLGL